MSRIGKRPIEAPKGVEWKISGQTVECKGPKGTRSFTATDDVDVVLDGSTITVKPRGSSKRARQQWGMTRTQIANLATGVTEGFKKELEIQGVGYRAQVQGKTLKLALGYSHDVEYRDPGRYRHEMREADRDRDHRHRPTAGRCQVAAEDPRLAPAGALQGQGRQATKASTSSARKARRSKGRTQMANKQTGPVPAKRRHARPQQAEERLADGRLRMSVHRSSKNISVQVIDDVAGQHALRSASSLEPALGVDGQEQRGCRRPRLARRLPSGPRPKTSSEVYFDRGGFLFHGKPEGAGRCRP